MSSRLVAGTACLLAATFALLAIACTDSAVAPGATSSPSPTISTTPTPASGCNPEAPPTPTSVPTATPTVAAAKPTPAGIALPPPGPEERWVLVDLSDQTATAMVGDEPWHTSPVTTGKPGFETPQGEFRVLERVANETMQSGSASGESWYVEEVLFTQYFTRNGHALHLNYWADDSAFGDTPTSHGCVGMRYRDAQFFWRFASIDTRIVVRP